MKIFSEDISFAVNELKKLSIKYSSWLENEVIKGEKFVRPVFKDASKKNMHKCKQILKRINEGISILENDKNAQTAFAHHIRLDAG